MQSLRLVALSGALVTLVAAACAPTPAAPTTAPAAPTAAPTKPAAPAAVASPSPSPSPLPSPAAGSPADQLSALGRRVDAAAQALQTGNLAQAKHEFEEFDEGWEKIEDGIRDKSRDAYRAIEDAMDEVEAALVKPATPDVAATTAALRKLRETIDRSLPALR